MAKRIHNFTEGERWALINALNTAAAQYNHDAEVSADDRVSRGFLDQAKIARDLADMIEGADNLSAVL